jgi:hypothetical protein
MSNGNGQKRYRSRTYWLCWGIVVLSAALTWTGKLDGAGWVTAALGTVGAWQARRAYDNKLLAENGGGK